MKRALILFALLAAATTLGLAALRPAVVEQLRAPAAPIVPQPTYPDDPARLDQWVGETLHELVHKKSAAAERWAALLTQYCGQGCDDCCGLQAYALQWLDRWDEAALVAARSESKVALFARARDLEKRQDKPAEALPLFERACDQGLLLACSNVGALYALGHGVDQDATRAETFYLRACDGGEAIACVNFGLLLVSLEDPAPNRGRAILLFEKACLAGYSRGCVELALATAATRSVAAYTLLEQACAQGDAQGCFEQSRALTAGRGVAADAVAAATLRRKSCAAGYEPACKN
jgi:TPR repeat protein